MKPENNNESKIDEMKDLLYSRSAKKTKLKRSILKKSQKIELQNDWKKEVETEKDKEKKEEELYQYKINKKNSIFYIVLFVSFTFFVGALAFAFFLLTLNKNEISLQDIDISIIGPNSIKSGEDLTFTVAVDNPSDIVYEDIDMTVYYPDSTIKAENKEFVKSDTRKINKDLLSGGKITESFSIIMSGSIGEKKDIKIDIFYKGKNYSGLLEKQSIYTVEIDSSPVDIELSYPKKITSLEEFSLDINVLSNITDSIYDLLLIGKYPIGFEVISTEPKSLFSETSKNVFKIDEIKPGEKKIIKVKGFVKGEEDEEKYFNFVVGDTVPFKNEMRTVFAEQEDKVVIKNPDISMELVTKKDNAYNDGIYSADDKVEVKLKLKNNLQDIISNIKITADIDGDIYNKKETLIKKGYYDSNKSRIFWDKVINDSFKAVSSGQFITDSMEFKINNSQYFINESIKNPELNLKFKVYGINFADAESKNDIYSEFDKRIKIKTNLSFSEEITYTKGPFKNIGEINPIVGEKTTYTVAWKISDTTSDVENVKVSTKLPIYVKYIDNTEPRESYFRYDEKTRILTLDYKKIEAFTGYKTEPKTAYFQIEYIPTATHIGIEPILVDRKYITAEDKYVNEDINFSTNASTAKLKFDDIQGITGEVRDKNKE